MPRDFPRVKWFWQRGGQGQHRWLSCHLTWHAEVVRQQQHSDQQERAHGERDVTIFTVAPHEVKECATYESPSDTPIGQRPEARPRDVSADIVPEWRTEAEA